MTADTVVAVCRLTVAPQQADYVAPNALSIAQAHFSPQAWFRAIYADDTPVGFVMLRQDPGKSYYHLWRFMIDARHQGMGFGRWALERVIEYVGSQPGVFEMSLNFVSGEHAPAAFYRSLGFVETDVENNRMLEMKLVFDECESG